MTSRKRTSCAGMAIILLLGTSVFCFAGGLWALEVIPQRVIRDFGPPAPGANAIQVLIQGFQLIGARSELLQPVDPTGIMRTIRIKVDQPVDSIAQDLEASGLIQNATAFRLFLIYSGLDRSIQAGDYQLSPAQSAIEIAYAIQNAAPAELKLRIFPGWRMEEIASALPSSGFSLSPQQFLSEARKPNAAYIPQSLRKITNFEGFYLAGSFVFKRDVSAGEMVSTILDRFDQQVTEEIRNGFERQGLNLSQAVILASIVEREAVNNDEQAMIASVFYNRLRSNMRLESDPTVQYALGFNQSQGTWWTNPLSIENLRTDSPYNTYLYPGLPPAAICNPGIEALAAVAYPAQTSYLYFRARCDNSGYHNFAITYEEHLKNGCP